MSKPRLLDLFCGAGGAAKGYQRAGFYVVGVDIKPQPRYCGDEFHQADALTFPLEGFDAIHASPPCQAYSPLANMWSEREYPQLIEAIRDRLAETEITFVIENVPGAPLLAPITLCGTMFGLGYGDADLRRHRCFEVHPGLFALQPPCSHGGRRTIGVYGGGGSDPRPDHRDPRPRTVAVYGHTGGYSKRQAAKVAGSPQQFPVAARREAMGIDWMTNDELCEAIPPAYTEWIGEHLMAVLRNAA